MGPVEQVLTVARMRSAEEALIASGTSVDQLMQVAGRGAAEWVWRIAGHHLVTVLCGPGNNGGDGYVIAEALRERGGRVKVIAACEPKTDAAKNARALFGGKIFGPEAEAHGDVLVDCLFGSGLVRPLSADHLALLQRLAAAHHRIIAVDLPSGIESDGGTALNRGLPRNLLTVALGAWKQAHFLMPASADMGELRLVGIGCAAMDGAPGVIGRPALTAPAADAHKYRRGLLAVIGGAMPGAAQLACVAAQGAGAGYVRLLAEAGGAAPDLVADHRRPAEALGDERIGAVLVGPGLGRSDHARVRLEAALASGHPLVLDADALVLLKRGEVGGKAVLTPHEGELAVLERTFAISGEGSKLDRALALARASGAVVIAKGPDNVVAAPDGRAAFAHRASAWLSTAGTGDVLAGIAASRLATGVEPFAAACQGVWLHGEAARLAGPAFSAAALAGKVGAAYAAAL
ncbi:NAD(P)H-hydrate epimerase [Novosphingobium flavum]|uniref:Bifunctional NAD(P)H-hydrate repair enzyme n=1 Tax=Novosphingobium flavum TaxID=1778672 RepID=A0A7X1FSQ0_9SPHN|nr:NAD(P)H-hydrate epimerase [Novosphingobium flavum]MBC2666271.1 NAD(P)H-hydrate epimerase [Novosphingobium flavum]